MFIILIHSCLGWFSIQWPLIVVVCVYLCGCVCVSVWCVSGLQFVMVVLLIARSMLLDECEWWLTWITKFLMSFTSFSVLIFKTILNSVHKITIYTSNESHLDSFNASFVYSFPKRTRKPHPTQSVHHLPNTLTDTHLQRLNFYWLFCVINSVE